MVLKASSKSSSTCKILLATLDRRQSMILLERSARTSVEHTSSFVSEHDPNTSQGSHSIPYWPRYTREEPQNVFLNSNRTYIKPDACRSTGTSFVNTIDRELLV